MKQMSGKVILVTGGARSGKSSHAETLTQKCGRNLLYIATAIPFDEEMRDRIKKHQESRGNFFETWECYSGFKEKGQAPYGGKDALMLDCITIMITNLMMDYLKEHLKPHEDLTVPHGNEMEKIILEEIEGMLQVFRENCKTSVLVTNETGLGLVPENYFSRLFRDIAGRMNQKIASVADEVYFCVSGIPMRIK